MTSVDLRDALELLDSALALIDSPDRTDPGELRRRLRMLSLEVDLLRARLGQPPAERRRN